MHAGVHNVYGQQVVLSYDKEGLLLGGSVAMMERSGSGSTNPSNTNYLNVHRVAKVVSMTFWQAVVPYAYPAHDTPFQARKIL